MTWCSPGGVRGVRDCRMGDDSLGWVTVSDGVAAICISVLSDTKKLTFLLYSHLQIPFCLSTGKDLKIIIIISVSTAQRKQ